MKVYKRSSVLIVECVIVISVYITCVFSFNLESRLPVIKLGDNGSYFGFSVAEHVTTYEDDSTTSWILVGAPHAQNLQPGTNMSGALYRCPLTSQLTDCEQVITDGRRNDEGLYEDITPIDTVDLKPPLYNDEIKDGQWMGVSVRSQGLQGKVVVCAHRYVRKVGEAYHGNGLCYTLKNDLEYDNAWEPCKGRSAQREHEEYGLCQVGTSSKFLQDGILILGSPGPFTWKGTFFLQDTTDNFLARRKTLPHAPCHSNSPVNLYSYMGMSVSGGRFFFPNNNSYVSGAPRGNGTGQFVFFNMKSNYKELVHVLTVEGEQFGSSFGYELEGMDLNGDGKDDLIVSAPFYFTKDSGGAVYIFINKNFHFETKYDIKLTGKVESRFGFSIANAGDMNKDGCNDLAVGAPYEGNGAVYIYLGNREKGLDEKPKQVIYAEKLPYGGITSFGYSLSGGLDLDFNGYPDLLVGGFEHDAVVLIFGRPIIDIKTFIRDPRTLKNIDPSKHGCDKDPNASNTCFSFEICCRIEAFVKPMKRETLELNYVIEAETFLGTRKFSRVYFNVASNKKSHIISKRVTIKKDSTDYCHEHIAYIKESTRDIQTPIKFFVNYTLVQDEPVWTANRKILSVERYPILNATEAILEFTGDLLRDCGTDDICQCDIVIGAAMPLPEGERKGQYILTLGVENEVHLIISVDNLGESAYEAKLFISHHPGLDYVAVNVTDKHVLCKPHNKTLVECSIGNPFKKQLPEPRPITLRFDPKLLEDHELSVEFSIFANSTSQDKIKRNPTRVEAMIVKNAELSIKGSARPEQVFYGGIVKGESAMKYFDDVGSKVLHTYQVFNLGPWRVNSVEVIIEWPHQVANNKPQGKWLLYPDSLPTVDAQGGGTCHIPGKYVNPLNLTPRPGVEEPSLENLMMNDPLAFSWSNKISPESDRMNETRASSLRSKRDSEMIVKAQARTDNDGKKRQVIEMSCHQNTAKCIKIHCVIYKLSRNQPATISITGRLWNSSLVEDYPRVDRVTAASRATLKLPSHYKNNLEDDMATVETIAYPDLVFVEPEGIPIWVYIVSSLAGLIVLICFILCLWKLGFFKRRRPDPTLSGNLEKNHEASPFLGK